MRPSLFVAISAAAKAPLFASVSVSTDAPMVNVPVTATASVSGGTVTGWQWKRNGSAIGGATSATYTPVSADVGTSLSVTATATGPGGTSTSTHTCSSSVVSDLTQVLAAQGSLGTSTNFSPTISPALDFSANRYVWQYSSATWTSSVGTKAFGLLNSDGSAKITFGGDPATSNTLSVFEGDYYNTSRWEPTSYGSNAITPLSADTAYVLRMEAGMGSAHASVNGTPIFQKNAGVNNALMGVNRWYRGATTGARLDPGKYDTSKPLSRHVSDAGVTFGTLTIWRREWASIRRLIILGNSIGWDANFDARLRTTLGEPWFLENNAESYRQTREMRSAILTPFPTTNDVGTSQRYYNDLGKYLCPSARKNIVLIHTPATNDLRLYGASATSAPSSLCGGYTFTGANTNTDSINNIVQTIANIRTAAASAGCSVYVVVTTTLALDGYSSPAVHGNGTDGYGEAKRRAVNAATLTGSIAAAADQVIDLDPLFAPGGSLYNASYADLTAGSTSYCRNTAYFLNDGIHPNATGAAAIADYIAGLLPS